MAKRTIGRTWKTIDQQQRARFVELFTKLLENAYIGKLESYTGTNSKYVWVKINGSKS
jgi:phospholipid transport system substrate-binding protein